MNDKKKYTTITQNAIVENINNIIDVNNRYKNKGYKLSLKEDSIEVIYNNSVYCIKVAENENNLYWHLEPYASSYFETKIDNCINSFEMLMVAIFDNETIHKERKKENE